MKIREFKDRNYRAIFFNGKTFRFAVDPSKPVLPLKFEEFQDVKLTNFCDGACQYCFVPGTKVLTIDGEKNIEDVLIYDTVFSMNEMKFSLECSVVEQLYKRDYDGILIVIELENGKIIECTPNHRLYVKSRGWIKAEELNEEDDIMNI